MRNKILFTTAFLVGFFLSDSLIPVIDDNGQLKLEGKVYQCSEAVKTADLERARLAMLENCESFKKRWSNSPHQTLNRGFFYARRKTEKLRQTPSYFIRPVLIIRNLIISPFL